MRWAIRNGKSEFRNASAGWHVISATVPGFREVAKAVHDSLDNATLAPPIDETSPPPFFYPGVRWSDPLLDPIRVLTVCEALENREVIHHRRVVIVGIFKSGMDETLRLDCPEQLVSGDVGWPSAVGLTRPSEPPEALRDEIEKKRQEVIKSSPPEAPLRAERVVGLYGYFVSVAGLTAAACCKAPIETVLPPARLFGLGETDFRVIR